MGYKRPEGAFHYRGGIYGHLVITEWRRLCAFPLFHSCTLPTPPSLPLPSLIPRVPAHPGAIKVVVGGANVMSPGINSVGGAVTPAELPEGAPVAVYAKDKPSAMAVGFLKMSTVDMCVGRAC